MNRLLLFLTLAFSVLLPITVKAEQPLKISLDDAVSLCLEKSWEIRSAHQKVAEAEGGVVSARAAFMPTITAQGSYTRLSEAVALETVVPIYGTLQVPVFGPTGDTIGFTYVPGIVDTAAMDFSMWEEDNYLLTVGLQQPLFTWGRRINGYLLANHNLKAHREDYKRKKQDVVFNVTRLFYSVLVAREFLKLTEEGFAQMETHAKSAARLYQEGKISRLDLIRANVARENMKPQVLRARNAVELTTDGLKLAIGLDATEEVEVSGGLTYEPVGYDLEEHLSAARKHRPDLKALRERREMAARALAIAQAANKPTIVASANYEYKKPYNFENVWDKDWSATVAITIPIFQGFSTVGESRKAKAQLEQARAAEEAAEALVELDVKSAYLALKEAEESIESQRKNVEEAEEAFRIAEEQFANGLLSNVEYLDTQLALSRAKANYIKALGDFNIARAALNRAVGRGDWEEESQ